MSPNAWFWHLHPNTCDILVSISAIDTNAYGGDDEMGKGGQWAGVRWAWSGADLRTLCRLGSFVLNEKSHGE